MRKFLTWLILFVLLITSAYSFSVYDSQGNSKDYFSVNSPNVFIEADTNEDYFNVTYEILNQIENKTFLLENCEDSSNQCGNFNIMTLFKNVNNTFVAAKNFEISLGSENKTVFFDFENPEFEIVSSEIDDDTKELIIEVNYSDSFGEVKNLEVYSKNGNNLSLLENTSTKNTLSYPIEASKDLNLIFRVNDVAGNFIEERKTFYIADIFSPKIESYKIINKYGDYSIEFTAKDDELRRYEVLQDNLSVSGSLSGKSFTTTVSIPFDSDEVELVVEDNSGNKVSEEFDLDQDPLNIEILSEYSRQEELKLESNAKECTLHKFDRFNENREFSKDGNEFRISLDNLREDNFEVEVYCDSSSYRLYNEFEFSYDVSDPEEIEISGETANEGYLILEWDRSEDEFSGIDRYELYRDDDEIYSGSSTDYNDRDVEVDENYDYYVRVYDIAGNYAESNEIELSPDEVNVEYNVDIEDGIKVNDSNFEFEFDPGSDDMDLEAKVYNNDFLIDDYRVNNLDSDMDIELELEQGDNEIQLRVRDRYGNQREDSFTVEYEKPILVEEQTEVNESQILSEVREPEEPENNVSIREENQTAVIERTEDRQRPWLLWILLVIVLSFIVIGIVFLVPEKFINFGDSNRPTKSRKGSSRNTNFNFLTSKDDHLDRDLKRIQSKRAQKQEELKQRKEREQRQKKKQKEREEMSEFQKQKLKDLSNKRDIEIPFEKREKAKKRVNRIRKEAGNKAYDDIASNTSSSQRSFGKKNPEKEKEFSSYINKIRSSSSWTNTNDYRHKEEPVKEEKEVKEEKPQEKPSQDKSVKNQDNPAPQEEKPSRKEHVNDKIGINDYLHKRSKNKKRFFHFAEREVDRDLNTRFKK